MNNSHIQRWLAQDNGQKPLLILDEIFFDDGIEVRTPAITIA
jgi:hypothetical protein